MNYTAVNFTINPFSEDIADALIGEMSHIGYDGFQYTDTGFTAYIPENIFNSDTIGQIDLLSLIPTDYKIDWTTEHIEDRDWNKEWEDNFTPIVVNDRILVRASFHETIPGIEHEIIIDPKMSFGTGHHSTTSLMLETILEQKEQIKGKRILDMGCGTGILSIMASKAGAENVTGIDIDEWSFNNAMENIRNNRLKNIDIKIGDAQLLANENNFDVILANINRNILLNDMHHYIARLNSNGYLIMSGFYTEDLPLIQKEAERRGLSYLHHKTDKNWVAVCFYKK